MADKTIRSPFALQDNQSPVYASTIAVTITNEKTVISPGTLTGNTIIDMTLSSELKAGAELVFIFLADGTARTVDFGTGFLGATADYVVQISSVGVATFIYNGTAFYERAEPTGYDLTGVADNTTHRSSDGTDHANVVTNDTHVAGDGSDHTDVATNTTHITSDGKNHADVVTNTSGVATNVTDIANISDGTTPFTGEIENTANDGTAAADVAMSSVGTGKDFVTTLSFTDLVIGAPNAGNNSAHGVLLFTFPAGNHLHMITTYDIELTVGSVTTDQPDVGIGSIVGSGANALLDAVGATSEDYITGQTWAVALDGTAQDVDPIAATAGLMTGISLNGPAGTKSVYLNVADGWAGGVTGDLTATGTVTIKWSYLNA